MGNAELWFMALKKQGVPVELVRYPRSTHELSRSGEPWLVVDRLGRLRQWFAYWLQDARGGTTTAVREQLGHRSGERRVGEEGRSRGAADHLKKKKKNSSLSQADKTARTTPHRTKRSR